MSKFKFLLLNNVSVKIGILGGSFNPPHEGHVHISLETLKRFDLSHVFWLVTPCSPTKNSSSYEDLTKRVQKCVEITKPYSNKITILDIEKFFKNFYSANTIECIKTMHPNAEIYWIIGCDNILQISKWYKWKNIFEKTNVVVCERSEMSIKLHNTKPAHNFEPKNIYSEFQIDKNILNTGTTFFMLHIRKIDISSTKIRHML